MYEPLVAAELSEGQQEKVDEFIEEEGGFRRDRGFLAIAAPFLRRSHRVPA